jgi:hypothetical protein
VTSLGRREELNFRTKNEYIDEKNSKKKKQTDQIN